MSPFSRRAIAVFIVATCALLLPGAYTAADEDQPGHGPQAAEASPTPEPTTQPTPDPTPTETPDEPEPTPSSTPSLEPTSSPSPQPTATPPTDESPRVPRGEQPDEPLHLSLGAAPATIDIGEETIVGVTLTNPNDEPAENVDAVVTLPRQLGFVSSDPAATSVSRGTTVSFDDLEVPAQSWLTIAVTAEGLEETRRPATITARAAWRDSHPSDTATVNVVAPDSQLRLTTSGPGLLSTVGQTVTYGITLRNVGDAPLLDVAIVNLVPAEVHVTSAGLAPGIDAVQVGSSGNAEDVVWTIDEMDAGEVVRVSYAGVVEKPGDLEALNRTRARARGAESVEQSERSYLATISGGGSSNPSFDPIVDRRVVTERVVERTVVRRRLPTEPGGVSSTPALPYTGLDPWGIAAFGIILIGFGVMFIRFGSGDLDRRRLVALTFLVLLIGGACISSDSDPDASGPDDTRVKGRQIERGESPDQDDDADQPDDDGGGAGNGTGDRGDEGPQPPDGGPADGNDVSAPDDGDDGDDDGSPVVTEPPEDDPEFVLVPGPRVISFESRVVTETLTEGELTIETVPAILDAAPATFTWNNAGGGGGGTASSRHAGIVEITTSVVPSGPGMRATVTIANISDRVRADIAGRLDLVLSGSGGAPIATLAGERVDALLNPNGEASASFTFRLPSGSYAARGLFRSS